MNLLPDRLTSKYRLVPLSQGVDGVLSLAVTQPLSVGGLDQVKRRLGIPLRLILVDEHTMDALLTPPPPKKAEFTQADVEDVHEALELTLPPVDESEAVPSTEEAESESRAFEQQAAVTLDENRLEDQSTPDFVLQRTAPVIRPERPLDWHPERIDGNIPDELLESHRILRETVLADGRKFLALVGPDRARDIILRAIFYSCWSEEEGAYIDLFRHQYPQDFGESFPSVLIIDGIDMADDEEGGEQAVLLQDVGRAYSGKVPIILGLRKEPKQAVSLSSGLRLTLGLARVVDVDLSIQDSELQVNDRMFHRLLEDTSTWSRQAFPDSGFQPLLDAIASEYAAGQHLRAVSKGCELLARRLIRLDEVT